MNQFLDDLITEQFLHFLFLWQYELLFYLIKLINTFIQKLRFKLHLMFELKNSMKSTNIELNERFRLQMPLNYSHANII